MDYKRHLEQRVKLLRIKRPAVVEVILQHGPCGTNVKSYSSAGELISTFFVGAPLVVGPTDEVGYNRNPLYTPPTGVS